jgi:hypothetical protein
VHQTVFRPGCPCTGPNVGAGSANEGLITGGPKISPLTLYESKCGRLCRRVLKLRYKMIRFECHYFIVPFYDTDIMCSAGLFKVIFGQQFYTPLCRLVYSLVLIHPALQVTEAASVRHSEDIGYFKWVSPPLKHFLALESICPYSITVISSFQN